MRCRKLRIIGVQITKEDAVETSKRQEEKANQTFKARANRKEEPKEKKSAKNEAVYEVICGG